MPDDPDVVDVAPIDAGRDDVDANTRRGQPGAGRRVVLDELLDADGSVVIVLERDARVHSINVIGLDLLGAASIDEVVPGTSPYAILRSLLDHVPRHLLGRVDSSPRDAEPADARSHRVDHANWHGDFDHTDLSGRARVYRATVVVRADGESERGGHLALIAHDVTQARVETARLRHRATHDPLTGLANRRQVLSVLREAIARQRGRTGHVAAFFIDLDRLKYVNDALGHQVGDRLLVSTAERLAQAVRPNDHVARIGGDEFLVVSHDLPDTVTALELSERMRRALSGRLHVRTLDLEFSVSIGIALSDTELLDATDDEAAAALISYADTAMYEAKRTGRSRSTLFTSQMRSAARERTELAAALSHAITNGDLEIDYQPVFSAVDQSVSGSEALVRWQHPTRGRIDPLTFVSIAEESGSIGRLGEFVLRQALADLRWWIDDDLVRDDFTVHANVSQVQLSSSSFVHQVLAALREHHLEPRRLVLEARESALGGTNIDVQRTVRALRRVGVRIAVDNFGTGANALSVLTDVGADLLKLDRSLALPSGSSESDTRLVRALVLLAHALDMGVIAERVSGAEQLRRLRSAGCDYVQGNLLAPPMRAGRFDPSTAPWTT